MSLSSTFVCGSMSFEIFLNCFEKYVCFFAKRHCLPFSAWWNRTARSRTPANRFCFNHLKNNKWNKRMFCADFGNAACFYWWNLLRESLGACKTDFIGYIEKRALVIIMFCICFIITTAIGIKKMFASLLAFGLCKSSMSLVRNHTPASFLVVLTTTHLFLVSSGHVRY